MADKVYPEGVTSLDHVNHDMKMGRFPNQSSVETFLKERAVLAAQEKVGHLPSGDSLHNEMVAALKMADQLLGQFAGPGWPEWGEAAVIRSVLAKATGSKPDPA